MTEQEINEEIYMTIIRRWIRVADLEHSKYCTERHDCHLEVMGRYFELAAKDRTEQ